LNEVVRGVNFLSYLFASFVAGYVMMGVDFMLDGFMGLFGTYKTYIELIKLWGVFKGFEDWVMALGHTLNSSVLALVFVHPKIYMALPFKNGLLKGLVFGTLWHIVVLFSLVVTAFGGAPFMKGFLSMGVSEHISLLILHIMWGTVLGLLYTPPQKINTH